MKKVYDHNVVLKSKHEALVAKIPMSPSLSQSPFPDPMSNAMHLSHSVSESNVSDPLKARARKVSIAMTDISLLADQNAELLSKLERLEKDATATDIAGRRELKRLEKEIVYLRDALDKTLAKSEELEGKVQDAVASDAVRRKKEREAMRISARTNKSEGGVLDFAPPGSKFGGPSERCSLLELPKEESPIRNAFDPSASSDIDPIDEVVSDQVLITCLLNKVKELEEANSRILRQQAETANQLAHVQQETMNMTKVYELLSDHDAVQLELEAEEDVATDKSPITEMPTIRFRSLRRSFENSLSHNDSFVFPQHVHGPKPRKTVLGLFDDQEGVTRDEKKAFLRRPSSADFFGDAFQTSTISSASSSSTGPLSPLHFLPPILPAEYSQGRTLQTELESTFGQGIWNLSGPNHMRTGSLSNLSQFSIPPSPSPAPSSLSYTLDREVRTPTPSMSESDSGVQKLRQTPEFDAENSLRLSVEPPTPDGVVQAERTVANQKRLQNMSRTLKLRKGRWIDRMSYDGHSQEMNYREISTPSLNRSESNRKNSDASRSDFSSQVTAPQAQRGPERELEDEDAQAIISTRDEDQVTANESFMFRVWLWFQFAIVVIFFVFAMARKGPGVVLTGGERLGKEKSVTRR